MQLSRLLYSSLPAPDSAFLYTRCDSRCGEYLYSHGKWKIHYLLSICNFYTHVKFNFFPFHNGLSPDIQASVMPMSVPWLLQLLQLLLTTAVNAEMTTALLILLSLNPLYNNVYKFGFLRINRYKGFYLNTFVIFTVNLLKIGRY